jgi:uncharacterized protein RhaS with RHS repeats
MKKTVLFMTFFALILRGVTVAQNPYESIGKKAKVLTLSNGKYQEIFTNDTIVPIGSVMYNRVTGDIVAFLTRDTMYAEYNLEPEVVSRWLSPDPLGAKYPQWSPYNYTLNNPIRFIDPDGREVIAPSQASKDLVLKTATTMFGKNHGYSFNGDNKLVQNGTTPTGMSAGQTAMFNFFNGALVNSKTKTVVKANESMAGSPGGNLLVVKSTAAATTFYEAASSKVAGNEQSGTIKVTTPANQTILVPENTVNNGNNVAFTDGTKSVGADHSLAHEFGHGIMNVIMNEMGGVFNGTDFNKMTEQERSDWSIRFTNTLMKSQGNTQETGEGQHGQTAKERPKNSLKPINE